MEMWGITHRGMVREQNQDAFLLRQLPDGGIAAVVCDGMGGAKAGNIASTMAAEIFMDELLQVERSDPSETQRWMEHAAALANDQVFDRSLKDSDCTGMGTTLVAAVLDGGEASILNEGDSRAYHISDQGIAQVTRDHSLVEDLVERGELTPEQARNHPHKNLITRAIGAEPLLRADFFHLPIQPGECLLLCSDGLSNLVTDQEILYEVVHGGEKDSCCQRLLDIALHRGAPDNVTVVLLQC
ncbi:MAG: Stp1/IreP family PP2C-type Ser/Thr phosphatase [Clostridium sp.]|nr:Stp1/IreP family PP2C-type Ser/Thr phosphatase [Clostridium sp.]